MVSSKGWDWASAEQDIWKIPAEESYYYCQKWKQAGKKSILDLGCGLGRHSLLFAENGFKVTAVDISDYAIHNLRKYERAENPIRSVICDMKNLPFSDNAFDCIFSYHVISHTDTEGFERILSEIKRVLKHGGEIFLTLCSKETWSFKDAGYPVIDKNTIVKTADGPEKDIPHFYVNFDDIIYYFKNNFQLINIRHIDDCVFNNHVQNSKHYFIYAKINKEFIPLDYSNILGKKVSGTIDRPLGSAHPKHPDMIYPVNYGYVDGVIGGDGAFQDVYFLGADKPLQEFVGEVIAVVHRLNDNEDKWIVAAEDSSFSKDEIISLINFQEQYFDYELFVK